MEGLGAASLPELPNFANYAVLVHPPRKAPHPRARNTQHQTEVEPNDNAKTPPAHAIIPPIPKHKQNDHA